VRWSRALGTAATRPGFRLAVFAALAFAAAWPYLVTAGQMNEFRDANVLLSYEDAARRTVLDFHQWPLWNPWYCGGLFGLATPQSRFAAPPFLLSLLFGANRGESLTVFASLLLALEGTFRFLVGRGASRAAAVLSAPVFGLFGLFACAPYLGWHNFLGFALLPWALWGVRRAARGQARGAIVTAGAFAWIIGFGGTYVAPLTALACVLETLVAAWGRWRKTSWRTVAVGGLLSLALAAFRLWPILEELARAPRVLGGGSANEVLSLLGQLFDVWPPFKGTIWYLVGLPAGIVALGALTRRRALGALVPALVWFWVALGYGAKLSLYGALRQLPLFSMLRAPERFLTLTGPFIALGAAWALTDLVARLRKKPRWSRVLTGWATVTALALVANVPWQLQNFRVAASSRGLIPPPEEEPRPFHQARGNRWAATLFAPMSRGTLACWEAYPVPQSAKLRGDLTQESYLADDSAGSVDETFWSPNLLRYTVTLTRPTTLLVNQNHHPGWHASVGEVVNQEGLLGVALPAGSHDVRLSFEPRAARGGFATSAVALVVAAFFWRRRQVGRWVALALLPALPALAIGLSSSERLPVRELRAADGTLVIADAPPPGAKPWNVAFEGGVTLQAVHVTELPELHRVRLELDWVRGAEVEKGLGFFAHLEPSNGKRVVGDHPLVSGVLALEQAPVGKTLRDVVMLDVPQTRRGQKWNVWVGLWAERGDGSRKRILTRDGVEIDAERLRLTPIDAN
jgi:hypothetical protein